MRKINTLSQDVLSIRSVGFDRQLKNKRLVRTGAYAGLTIMLLYAVACILPPIGKDDTNATTKPSVASDTILSINIDDSAISLELTPTSASGTFATTSTPINVAVATNNITGYTVGIKASSNNDTATMLVNSVEQCENTPTSSKCSISTIDDAVSATDYAATTATELNNTWGYLPSKYNSVVNEDYLPAPTSTGDVIDATSAPNTPQSGRPDDTTDVDSLTYNEYTIDLGARLDYTPYAGSYTNTFVITAVGNPVPYSVTYEGNKPIGSSDSTGLQNMPSPQIGTVTSGNTMAVLLSAKVPDISNSAGNALFYAPYVFTGWCTIRPDVPDVFNGEPNTYNYQVCPDTATLYQPGDTYGIDQTQAINTDILYATWQAPATVTFDGNGMVFNGATSDTTNTVKYIPTYDTRQVTGVRMNDLQSGQYIEPTPLTVPTNYIFKGWGTDPNATEATYVDEAAIKYDLSLEANESLTLYAVWSYTTVITFDGNGNDADNTPMADITIEAGSTEALPQNAYTKEGYVFNGWNTVQDPTEQDPGETYQDQADYEAEVGPHNVTLYAQWMEPPKLYDYVKALVKKSGDTELTQSAADLQATITTPTTTDPATDISNSGVYKYDTATFGTASDAANDYNIYYYRGVLEPTEDNGTYYGSDGKATTYPNYVRLANNTCWRIVRTTGSGGVKMIYNGTWQGTAESGTCANNQTDAQLTTSPFNKDSATVAGKSYTGLQYNNMHVIGYTYSNVAAGTTSNTALSTLLGATGDDTTTNTNSSIIKQYIEDWYSTNMVNATNNYTSILEESAGYCNDRSVYNEDSYAANTVLPDSTTVIPYGTSSMTPYYFGAYTRNYNAAQTPSLTCPRGIVDTYSTTTTSGGNGQLTHPIALLTADELSFAGSGGSSASEGSSYNAKSYLRSGVSFWLLSPNRRYPNGNAGELTLYSSGSLNSDYGVQYAIGVRPAISLKPGTYVTSGNGTATSPWTINE